ncbi:acetylxylan esterase [Mucilaginibacter sp. PPCGB 2223]|uniref:glucuronyl esterase domain-containing protein n=1 Tax=Mucilaginibacter sp. PPCGB 2223 TaxID=1886027 RepID=UPI000825084E|nr:acetylxylan esterase [Mucilaginibacter sp. PPCGB 2223]OCX53297.1 acetylxylan esterase [Mucilaginibacter sp. PPCGB 2223]
MCRYSKSFAAFVFQIAVCTTCAFAQQSYTLPDVLTMSNGKKVTTAKQWFNQRRPELLSLFKKEMYGQSPASPANMSFRVFDEDKKALNGEAIRKQITVYFTGKADGPQMDILLYIPNNVKKAVPAIVGLNFDGNHAVNADPGIKLSASWFDKGKNVVNNRATEAMRGTNASQWPLETIIGRGYAVVTVYRGDIAPDHDHNLNEGVFPLYPELQNRPDNFATVSAWAWGLSRILDYLETDKAIDSKHVAVFGFSRLGKAALWAGATDSRFALVISNESGAGGAKLFHETAGEGIRRLSTKFPFWFCDNFKKYTDQDSVLPFDQHMVISLVAPRPIYIASAEGDLNSNPKGEFMGALAASPVYKLLGTKGLPALTMPPVNTPIIGRIAYHIRTGTHNVTDFDWAQYLNFADQYLKTPAKP